MNEVGQTGVVGLNYGLRVDPQRLWIQRQTPDGPLTVIETTMDQVMSIDCGLLVDSDDDDEAEPDQVVIAIVLADPLLKLDDDEELHRTPVLIRFPRREEKLVREVAHEARLHLYRSRRQVLNLPDATPPPMIMGPDGTHRPDLAAAVARAVGGNRRTPWHLIAPQIRPDEFVLEVAPTRSQFMVVTTLRVFFLPYTGPELHEGPIDAVMAVESVPEAGGTARLSLDLGTWVQTSEAANEQDIARLVQGCWFAIARRRDHLAPTGPRPDPCTLSEEWEVLRQHHQLGTVAEEDFRRQAMGLLQCLG